MICHNEKCIFIHIPKNAGQSVEHVFLQRLGLSWDTRAPLLLRQNDRPELGPPRLAHLKAGEYVSCRYVSATMFDSYYKFSFVRNPWSRMVSFYKYLGYQRRCDFKTFLMGPFSNRLFEDMHWFVGPQADYLYQGERLLVDFVGRFETLQQDFHQVCDALSIPQTGLPHVNKSREAVARMTPAESLRTLARRLTGQRIPVHADYRDYYDQATRQRVAELYARDISCFEYGF